MLTFLAVLALGVVVCLPGVALATITIGFDDLSTPNNQGGAIWGTVPVNYLGFTWTGGTGWEVHTNASFKSVYNNTGDFPSLPNAAYNDTGAGTMSISFGSLYDVSSAYFRSFSQNNAFQSFSETSVTLKGYYNNVLVGSPLVVTLSATGMVNTPINFTNIDRLDFIGSSGKWWLVDDIVVNPVPIPGALVLLGAGLVRLARYGRRKKALV
jgi:hypothetical protein